MAMTSRRRRCRQTLAPTERSGSRVVLSEYRRWPEPGTYSAPGPGTRTFGVTVRAVTSYDG
jgi:hypothetical protein